MRILWEYKSIMLHQLIEVPFSNFSYKSITYGHFLKKEKKKLVVEASNKTKSSDIISDQMCCWLLHGNKGVSRCVLLAKCFIRIRCFVFFSVLLFCFSDIQSRKKGRKMLPGVLLYSNIMLDSIRGKLLIWFDG
jgi:hypothetical protein